MAIAYFTSGTLTAGTTLANPVYPGGVSAGNVIILIVTGKYPSNFPTTPTDYTLIAISASSSGAAPGVDNGDCWVAGYYKIANGSETGTVVVDIVGGNTVQSQLFILTKSAGTSANIASASGAQNAETIVPSISFTSDPGITVSDLSMVALCGNTDAGFFTLPSLTVPGVSAMTSLATREATGTTVGQDHKMVVYTTSITTGTSSGNATFSAMTLTAQTVAGLLIRIRQVSAAVLPFPNENLFRGVFPGVAR